MTFDEDKDEWVLSSGRRFYAYSGALSVWHDQNTGGYSIGYGSDGAPDEQVEFTAEERKEIADHQITQWKAWADQGSED